MQQFGRISLAVILALGCGVTAHAQDNGANGNAMAVSVDSPAEKPKSAAEALQRELDVFFTKGSFEHALAYLSGVGNLQIEIDWAGLAETGLTPKTPVVLRASRVTVQRALELLLAQVSPPDAPAGWMLENNAVRISSQTVVARLQRARAQNKAGDPGAVSARDRVTAVPRELDFDGAPLEEVIETIRHVSGVPVHVNWRALLATGVDRDAAVTVQVTNLTLARTLTLILDDLSADKDKFDSLYWYVEEGIIRITSGRAINNDLNTRIFDIGDLLMDIPNFIGPRISMDIAREDPSDGGGGFWDEDSGEEETAEERRAATEEAIIKSVTALLDDDMWDFGGGRGSVQILGNRLILTQTKLGYLLMSRRR